MEVTWIGIGARETYRSKVDIFNSSRSTELAHKFLLLAFVENSADILFKVVVKKLAIQFLKRTTLEWIKQSFLIHSDRHRQQGCAEQGRTG